MRYVRLGDGIRESDTSADRNLVSNKQHLKRLRDLTSALDEVTQVRRLERTGFASDCGYASYAVKLDQEEFQTDIFAGQITRSGTN